MLPDSFVEEMEKKLVQKKEELLNELKNKRPHEELGTDQDSSAQEIENDEVSQDIIAAREIELEKVEKALAKIESGTYGTDDEGNEISEERLKVLPWADKAI
jgi:RNA polymerase-binding transcription factor DksA